MTSTLQSLSRAASPAAPVPGRPASALAGPLPPPVQRGAAGRPQPRLATLRAVLRTVSSAAMAIVLALAAPAPFAADAANPLVEFDTSAGRIRLELFPDAAPKTVENFLAYVMAKHYDGTQFHRVIPGFMIQGGGFTADFKQKPTRAPIGNEGERSSKAGLSNAPGTIAMARTSDPHSATAQFFINVADNKRLDFREPSAQGFGYTVFGKVVAGMDVVERIAATRTGPGGPFPTDVPQERVLIKSAAVLAR